MCVCVWLCLGLFSARLLSAAAIGAQGAAPVLLGSGLQGLGGSIEGGKCERSFEQLRGSKCERRSGKLRKDKSGW